MRASRRGAYRAFAVALLWTLVAVPAPAFAQGFVNFSRADGRSVLRVIKKDIQKFYYDPNYRGIDLDAHFRNAEEKIDSAVSSGHVFGIIAQALLDFGDSHTRFYPPDRAVRVEYGWHMRMVGETCYVIAVRPGSDAEAKGLKVGDVLLEVGGWAPTRGTIDDIRYAYGALRPQAGLRLVVRSDEGVAKVLDAAAHVREGARVINRSAKDFWKWQNEIDQEAKLNPHSIYEIGEALFIWRMPEWDMEARDLRRTMDTARRFPGMIIDLRGNGGGLFSMLQELAGYFVDHDVMMADVKGRKKTDSVVVKTKGKRAYDGDLVVLVDSESASASEVFARFMQLQGRGRVLGDRTAGAVMQSGFISHTLGNWKITFYGLSIATADLAMSDGGTLEHVGVTPDEILLPTSDDLAAGRDPVLSRAAAILGVDLGPEEAGRLFPMEWAN